MSFANVSNLAIFEETTAGTPPADWDASGLPFYTVGVPDISGLQKTFLEDERARQRALQVFDKIPGLSSTAAFPFTLHGQGTGQGVIADTSSAVSKPNSTILKNALGGQKITASTTLAVAGTHSTTSLELDVSTTYLIGGFVCIEDADATGDTKVYARRIISKAADVIGLDEALPFTPVDGDICHSSIQAYIDEDVLCNSVTGPTTLSYAVSMGGSSSPAAWECVGCQTNLTSFSIASNEVVTMEYGVMAGSFSEPDVFTAPDFATAISGSPGFAAGLGTTLFIQDKGTTTSVCINASELAIEPGVTSAAVPTVTECDAGMEGIAGHVLQPGDTTVTVTRMPYDSDSHADLKTQTHKVIRYSNDLAPGAGFAVSFPNCEINSTPVRGEADNRLATTVEYRAHEDDAIVGASVVEQQLSKLSIVQW